MNYGSGIDLREELLSLTLKYGLENDPVFKSTLERYLQLQKLQERYFQLSIVNKKEFGRYLKVAREANECANIIHNRVALEYSDAIKYSEGAKEALEKAKKEQEKRVKEVEREYNLKVGAIKRKYERELNKYEAELDDLNLKLRDRIDAFNQTERDLNERIRKLRKERDDVKYALDLLNSRLATAKKQIKTVSEKPLKQEKPPKPPKEPKEPPKKKEPEFVDPDGL